MQTQISPLVRAPWLESHNTCPICRFELPAQEVEDPGPEKVENENEEEEEENNGEFHPLHSAVGFPPGMRMLNLPGLHRLPSHSPLPHSIMRAASAAFEAMAARRSEAVERVRVRARSDEDVAEPEESEGTSTRRRRKRRRRVRTASDAFTSSESSASSSSSSS